MSARGHPGSAANESTPKFNGRRVRLIRALFNQRDPPAAGGEKVRKPRRSGRGGRRLRSQLITSVTPRGRRRPADASINIRASLKPSVLCINFGGNLGGVGFTWTFVGDSEGTAPFFYRASAVNPAEPTLFFWQRSHAQEVQCGCARVGEI